MLKIRIAIILLLCTLVITGTFTEATHAADTPSGLLQMLARVPDSNATRENIIYADVSAVEAAYPPAKPPLTWEQLQNAGKSDDPQAIPVDTWWIVVRNMMIPNGQYLLLFAKDGPMTVGFNFFDTHRFLSYGIPPMDVLQLEGQFNRDAIRSAFTALGFAKQDQTDAEVWCSTEGCDGKKMDIKGRNPANPFGGALGRKQPLLVGDGYLISSTDLELVKRHVTTMNKAESSLADVPKYRAAIETLTADGILLQAMIFDGEFLLRIGGGDDPISILLGERAGPQQRKELLTRLLETYQDLPQYTMIMIGDVITDTEQSGRMALVYDNEQEAEAAAKAITARIDQYQSLMARRPLRELLESRQVSEVKTQVVKHESTGKFVLLLLFSTPKATPDEILQFRKVGATSDPTTVTAPGLVYRLLVDMMNRLDIGWLATTPRATLEKLLQEMP